MKKTGLFALLAFATLFTSSVSFSETSTTDVLTSEKQNNSLSNAIIVHKPALDPTWGKVVQYSQEQAISSTDKSRETLHKFLLQDDKGIVRTATYHENAAGGGYWEVWVWDQP
jgi:hypothetical protein